MKTQVWIALPIALTVASSWTACGGGNASPGTGGQTTTTTTTTTTTSTTSKVTPIAACDAPATPPSNGSCYTPPVHMSPDKCHAVDGGTPDAGTGDGGDAGAFVCAGSIPNADACQTCVEGSCCAELAACNALTGCWDCYTNPSADPATCSGTAIQNAFAAIRTCQSICCQNACNPWCNPVTNAGCTYPWACDVDPQSPGNYTCVPLANFAGLCGTCDAKKGLFCGPGLTCLPDGLCGAYCCNAGDCGSGICDMTRLPNQKVVGVCVHK